MWRLLEHRHAWSSTETVASASLRWPRPIPPELPRSRWPSRKRSNAHKVPRSSRSIVNPLPGLWALADEARLKGLLEDAGFQSIRIEKLDDAVEFESAEQWIEVTRRLAGPLKALLANLDDDTRGAIEDRMREAAKPYELPDGRISMPEQILAASARVAQRAAQRS